MYVKNYMFTFIFAHAAAIVTGCVVVASKCLWWGTQ